MAAQSLLQLVKAPLHPSPLDKSALVIIDAQLEYQNGKLPLDGVDNAILEAAKLLKLARERGCRSSMWSITARRARRCSTKPRRRARSCRC
jgi:nicotinamidase-related amidase